MNAILQFVNAHSSVIGYGAAYFLIAAINHLPVPGTKITKYEYFYSLSRSLMNAPAVQKFAPPAQPIIPNEAQKGASQK